MSAMHPKVKRALEEIDAAVWNGDDFLKPNTLAELKDYLSSWQRFVDQQDGGTV